MGRGEVALQRTSVPTQLPINRGLYNKPSNAPPPPLPKSVCKLPEQHCMSAMPGCPVSHIHPARTSGGAHHRPWGGGGGRIQPDAPIPPLVRKIPAHGVVYLCMRSP